MCFETKPVGEPDAGNRHVRFDERGGETERCHMAQATAPLLDFTPPLRNSTSFWHIAMPAAGSVHAIVSRRRTAAAASAASWSPPPRRRSRAAALPSDGGCATPTDGRGRFPRRSAPSVVARTFWGSTATRSQPLRRKPTQSAAALGRPSSRISVRTDRCVSGSHGLASLSCAKIDRAAADVTGLRGAPCVGPGHLKRQTTA